jgi:hypothetical protein
LKRAIRTRQRCGRRVIASASAAAAVHASVSRSQERFQISLWSPPALARCVLGADAPAMSCDCCNAGLLGPGAPAMHHSASSCGASACNHAQGTRQTPYKSSATLGVTSYHVMPCALDSACVTHLTPAPRRHRHAQKCARCGCLPARSPPLPAPLLSALAETAALPLTWWDGC